MRRALIWAHGSGARNDQLPDVRSRAVRAAYGPGDPSNGSRPRWRQFRFTGNGWHSWRSEKCHPFALAQKPLQRRAHMRFTLLLWRRSGCNAAPGTIPPGLSAGVVATPLLEEFVPSALALKWSQYRVYMDSTLLRQGSIVMFPHQGTRANTLSVEKREPVEM